MLNAVMQLNNVGYTMQSLHNWAHTPAWQGDWLSLDWLGPSWVLSAWLDLVIVGPAWQLGTDVLSLPSWDKFSSESVSLNAPLDGSRKVRISTAHLIAYWVSASLLTWLSQQLLCPFGETNDSASESVTLNAPFTGHAKSVSLQLTNKILSLNKSLYMYLSWVSSQLSWLNQQTPCSVD